MWSFVGSKKCRVWIWFAIHYDTKEVLAVHFGDRSEESAKKFWSLLPEDYKQSGIAFTDGLDAYAAAFPQERLFQCEKSTGCTSYIERFNLTVRMQNSRLVRKSIGFSRKLTNHIGALFLWIHAYNDRINRNLNYHSL